MRICNHNEVYYVGNIRFLMIHNTASIAPLRRYAECVILQYNNSNVVCAIFIRHKQ